MPVGAAIGVSGLAGAAASVYAGNQQAKAAERASKVQQDAYGQMRNDLAPYRVAGEQGTNALMAALPDLTSKINFDNAWLENTPGYAFALKQGLKAVQNSAAARGLGTSGAALKGASQFATGLADQTYGSQVERELAQREQRFNQLMSTAQLGGNAAATTGQGALGTGQQVANNLIGGAAAQGAGLVGGANALTNSAGQFMGWNLAQQQLAGNRLLNTSGTGQWGTSAPGNLYSPTAPIRYSWG